MYVGFDYRFTSQFHHFEKCTFYCFLLGFVNFPISAILFLNIISNRKTNIIKKMQTSGKIE